MASKCVSSCGSQIGRGSVMNDGWRRVLSLGHCEYLRVACGLKYSDIPLMQLPIFPMYSESAFSVHHNFCFGLVMSHHYKFPMGLEPGFNNLRRCRGACRTRALADYTHLINDVNMTHRRHRAKVSCRLWPIYTRCLLLPFNAYASRSATHTACSYRSYATTTRQLAN